jgi:hypothetical protein
MGRPRLAQPAVVVQIKLHLRPDTDGDLVAFFAAIPPHRRAGFVKQALRSGGLMPASSSGGADEDELTGLAQGLLFQ